MEIQSGDLELGLLTLDHREAIKAQHKVIYSYEDILASEIKKVNPVIKGHTDEVMSLALTSNNNLLLSCSKDYTVRIWNLIRR